MKIIFIGGHHNSALVVARLLKERGHRIFWFGHKHTMRKEKSLSAEYLEIKKYKFPFFEIRTGKFYHSYNPLEFLKIIFGFFQSLFLLLKIKPDFIVSFGGYLAVPVVTAGFLLRIPAVTHEQTTQSGLANQTISFLVKRIFLTWQSSIKFFPKNKSEVIGLPLRKELFQKQKRPFKNQQPTILILGGKQGSNFINILIEGILTDLLKKYNLIHQTGRIRKTNDFNRLKEKRDSLPFDLKKRYILKPYFYNQEMARYLLGADLVISRAGAHIVYELMTLKKFAFLIPISWAYRNEQFKNALKLKNLGLAKIFSQKKIKGSLLLQEIEKYFQSKKKTKIQKITINKRENKNNAAQKMVYFIEKNN